jgi:hypothetical protein|tara:strand:+ start:1698 stop:1889 length:192 start_codon:yes stop_codon:yes gene_type:complete
MDYKITKIVNQHGFDVYRFEFENTANLESFISNNLIGNPAMANKATKAVNNVLLMWDRNQSEV